jgi:hypothetical protein
MSGSVGEREGGLLGKGSGQFGDLGGDIGGRVGPLGIDGTKDGTGVGDALQPLGPSGLIQTPSGAGIDEEELVGHGSILSRGCDTVGCEVPGCDACSASA